VEVIGEAGDGEEQSVERLTERELEVLRLASTGMTNNDIAERAASACARFRPTRYTGLIFGMRGEAT